MDKEREATQDPNQQAGGDQGEYGVEQVLASEEDLAAAREKSGYRFSQEQLDHKSDAVDTQQQ